MTSIEYYFYSASPFTYLGHKLICEIAEKHGARLVYKPVDVSALWAVSGGLPVATRPPVRQRLRLIELQRLADYRSLPINPKPEYFPVDATLADHAIIALVEAGHNPAAFMGRVVASVWAKDENVADPALLSDHLAACGFDAAAMLDAARSEAVAAIRARNSEDAVAADAVGVPTYVLNGEPFWGQDRIEHLDHALSTGRAPFLPM